MSNLLTVRQAAQYAQASERTIRRWIAKGDLPASRMGPKFVRIHQSDLDRMSRPIPSART
jgi:excisionase family DNA binding protein